MQLEYFERLEGKVEELINKYNILLRKNEELLEIIAQKDEDLNRLKAELENAAQERKRISERIEALLNKIDNLGTL